MKTRWLLWLSMCLVVILAACQKNVVTTQPEGTGAYPPPGQETPSGTQAYPAPKQPASQTNPSALYPAAKDGDTVTWDQAVAMLQNGEVAKVTQSQSLKVILSLKDGRSLNTTEPSFDDVVKVIAACGDKCKDIVVTNE